MTTSSMVISQLSRLLLQETPPQTTASPVLLSEVGPLSNGLASEAQLESLPPADVTCRLHGSSATCHIAHERLVSLRNLAVQRAQLGARKSYFMLYVDGDRFGRDLGNALITKQNIEHVIAGSIPNLRCPASEGQSVYVGPRENYEDRRKEVYDKELAAQQAWDYGIVAIDDGVKAYPINYTENTNLEPNPLYMYVRSREELYATAQNGNPATFLFALDADEAATFALLHDFTLVEQFTDLDGDPIHCIPDRQLCASGRAVFQEVDVPFDYDPQSVSCDASVGNIVSADYMIRSCMLHKNDGKVETLESVNYQFNSQFRALVSFTVDIESDKGIVRVAQTFILGAIAAQLGGSVKEEITNEEGRKMVHSAESARREVYASIRHHVREQQMRRNTTPACRPLTPQTKPEMFAR